MHPNVYRKKTRTGWCLGLILAALLLRLLTEPVLLPSLWKKAGGFLQSPRLFHTLLWLKTGGKVRLVPLSAPEEAHASPPSALDPAPAQSSDPTVGTETSAGISLAAESGTLFPESQSSETGSRFSTVSSEETGVPGQEASDAEEPEEAPVPESFTPEEAEAISLRGNCSYSPDKTALLLRPLDWKDEPGPKLMIIHTHSSEAYTPVPGHTYTEDGPYRTAETSETVVAVGDALARELEGLGIEVVHDRTCCDYPSYNSSYAVARAKIQAHLAQYPSIRMVIDLHRDAMDPPVRELADLGAGQAAALMLVIGTDEGGLSHPRWENNLSCGLKLQALANRSFPGLFKPISFRKERFNGDLTPGSLIVEVGSTGNTLADATAAMPALARILAELLTMEQPKSGQP